jgi:hypothetical protein
LQKEALLDGKNQAITMSQVMYRSPSYKISEMPSYIAPSTMICYPSTQNPPPYDTTHLRFPTKENTFVAYVHMTYPILNEEMPNQSKNNSGPEA